MPPRVEFDDINTFFHIDLGGTTMPYVHEVGMGKEIWDLETPTGAQISVIRFDQMSVGGLEVSHVVGNDEERMFYNSKGELVYWQVELEFLMDVLVGEKVEMYDFLPFVKDLQMLADEGITFRIEVDLANKALHLIKLLDGSSEEIVSDVFKVDHVYMRLKLQDEEVLFYTQADKGEAVLGVVTSEEEGSFLGYVRKLKGATDLLHFQNSLTPRFVWDVVNEL